LRLVLGPVRLAGGRLVLRPAARLLATEILLVLLALFLVAEAGAVPAPVVAHLTCSRRQASTPAWSPDSSTSAPAQPCNSSGRPSPRHRDPSRPPGPLPRRRGRSGTCPSRRSSHLLPPPGLDPRVVARQQHVRYRPAVELGRPRVVRILEPPAELRGEALQFS